MKKASTLALVVTIAVVVSFVLGAALPTQAGGWHGRWWHERPTVLDKLEDIDGAQALVAAVELVDKSNAGNNSGISSQQASGCPAIGELLDDRGASLTVLAPTNNAFEDFFGLQRGALQTYDVEAIEILLPGILKRLELSADDLCKVLLKHVSVEGVQSKRALLREGEITVLNTDYAIAISEKGVAINYDNAIVEADVYTVNGVIHYLDKVIAKSPAVEEETPPPPPEEDDPGIIDKAINGLCSRGSCGDDPSLSEACVNFMNDCLANASGVIGRNQCWGEGLYQCTGIE